MTRPRLQRAGTRESPDEDRVFQACITPAPLLVDLPINCCTPWLALFTPITFLKTLNPAVLIRTAWLCYCTAWQGSATAPAPPGSGRTSPARGSCCHHRQAAIHAVQHAVHTVVAAAGTTRHPRQGETVPPLPPLSVSSDSHFPPVEPSLMVTEPSRLPARRGR